MGPTVQAVYYRGGSSKAVFFHGRDIPSPGPARDQFIKRIMGSPDVLQIDGMGGSRIITSKVAIIDPSERSDADVDYTFAQVGITEDSVGYTGNCGNISSAVGPFAITEGLVKQFRPGVSVVQGIKMQEVRIYNTGTKKVLVSHVPVDGQSGDVLEAGEFSIAAVPGTGAPILMDYSEVCNNATPSPNLPASNAHTKQTLGATEGKGLLPTSKAVDMIQFGGKEIQISICDVANIVIFVAARDVGLKGSETADDITNNAETVMKLKEIRGKGAQVLGRCTDWEEVDTQSPFLPMVVVIAPDNTGKGHISSRLMLDNRCHDSMAGTGAICTAACSRIYGSVVHQQLKKDAVDETVLNIHHPLGIMPVTVMVEDGTKNTISPAFRTLSFVRTARRIMDGKLYVPVELEASLVKEVASHDGAKPSQNGHIPIQNGNASADITDELCSFVSNTKFDDISPDIVAHLLDLLIDHIGVGASGALGSESSDPFLKAIQSLDNGSGKSTVYTKGKSFSLQNAALLNGAFAHSFDFDDTLAVGVIHPGVSVIPAALAQSEASNASGHTLLLALAVGYEVACRLGRGLGTGGYPRGFHNTGTAGIFGAVAAIAKLKGLSKSQIDNAFGLAASKASGSMQFLDNGSWNKRLHPGFAAHDAFMCVALAEAGVVGASRSIEGKWGFLNAYSETPNFERVTDGLGRDWIFAATALKPYPACRMTHTAIEMSGRVSTAQKSLTLPDAVNIRLSPPCFNIVGVPTPNKRHPKTIVDAQFSIYYQVAIAWLYGSDVGWAAYGPEKMADAQVAELCDRIEVVSDENITDLEAVLTFSGVGGGIKEERMVHPLGEVENPFSSERVRGKFKGLATPAYGEAVTEKILKAVDSLVDGSVKELTDLL